MPADWLARWNFDPVLLAAIAIAWTAGFIAFPQTRQRQAWLVGIVLALFVSPLCALGSALFAARVGHHLLLSLLVAPLLVAAWGPRLTAVRVSLPILTALQAAAFWAWHVPQAYEAAMRSDAVFWIMQVSITLTAALWWSALRRASALAAAGSLLASMVQMGLLGALIVFAGRPLYAPHWASAPAWGLAPVEDQQIAGLLMWVAGGAVYLLLAAANLYRSFGQPTIVRPA